MKYLIIGNSAAGSFAAEAIREVDQEGEITILTDESYPAYSRCLTSYYIGGSITEELMYIRDKSFYKDNRINILYSSKVTKVYCGAKSVLLEDGKFVNFDKLLIATGAAPKKLKIPGIDLGEVFYLRTLEDAKAVRAKAKASKSAIVLGAGLVSLKGAYNLLQQGLEVTVLVSSNQILSQALDQKAAQIVQDLLETKGMKFLFGTKPVQIRADEKRSVTGVLTDDDQTITGDLVLVGKGVSPNMDFLKGTSVTTYDGIFVNEYLETTVPDIYAAGDVAETFDFLKQKYSLNAIWPNAAKQGRIAGFNMAGKRRTYEGSLAMNSVDFFGLPVISVGLTKPTSPEYREQLDYSKKKNTYRKLIYRKDQLVGYILVGDISEAGRLMANINRSF